jgi:SAM-dependent methyltransferase
MWMQFGRANALNPAQRHRFRLIVGELRRRVSRSAPLVVDLGCGSGLLLSHLARALPAARRVGVDVAPRALELARLACPHSEFVKLDLEADPPAPLPAALEGRAAAVVASEVLEHLDRPECAVALARRLCAPDARLVVTVPAGPMTPFDLQIGHRRHFTPATLAELLAGGGFAVERVYRWGFPFHSLFRLAMAVAPGAAALYTDDRLPLPARLAWELLYGLFFLNRRHGRLGRQLVAVAAPR